MRCASPLDQPADASALASTLATAFASAALASASLGSSGAASSVASSANASTLVQPGLVVLLPPGWQPTAASRRGATYTLGVVTDVRRVPKEIEVCASPDRPPPASSVTSASAARASAVASSAGGARAAGRLQWDGLGLGGPPQRGVVQPVFDPLGGLGFVPLVAVDPALLEARTRNIYGSEGGEEKEKENGGAGAATGADVAAAHAAVAAVAAAAQLALFGLCGEHGCEAVYRVRDGDVACDFGGRGSVGTGTGDQLEAASVFGREVARRQQAEAALAAVRARKEGAKQRKDWSEVVKLEALAKAAAVKLEASERRLFPQQLWCPFCLWEPTY
jgi:hypothetical protein